MSSQPTSFLTPEQYLEIENKADRKSEYCNGQMYAMAGASPRHVRLVTNIVYATEGRLRKRGCGAYAMDLRLRVRDTELYTYPDIMIVCGKPAISDTDPQAILNPIVIFEVISPSTEAWDRGEKFAHYRGIPSLREYLMVAQDRTRVEQYTRQADGITWTFTDTSDLAGVVRLSSVDCDLPVSEIYYES